MIPRVEVCARNLFINGKELVLGLLVASIWWPVCLVIYVLNVSLRSLVQKAYDTFHGPGVYKVADGEDGVFGHRIKNNCNSLIQGYQVIRGTPNLGVIRGRYLSLLNSSDTKKDYSRLQYTFTDKWGYFCWEQDANFDINRHIKVLDNWDVNKEADERKLMDIIAELVMDRMTTEKPQWEVLVVPKYRLVDESGKVSNERHYALITRFNHAYSDAISYFLMLNNYIADSKAKLPMDPTTLPFKVPYWAKLVVWVKAILLGPYYFVATMIVYIFDRSVFSTPYYSDTKLCAKSPSIKLETIKQLKKKSGTSFTAILYASVYSALYKSHVKKHKNVQVPPLLHLGSVMAMFPYWTKKKLGNQFTLWPYSAPLELLEGDCLKRRLEISHEINLKGMGSPGPVFNFYLSKALGSIPKLFHPLLWQLSGCPIMVSNVPGFSSPLKIYGGEMVEAAGFLPLMSTIAVGLSTVTYVDKFYFAGIVDPVAFKTQADLQEFLDDIISDMKELAVIYNVEENSSKEFAKSNQSLQKQSDLDANGNIMEKEEDMDSIFETELEEVDPKIVLRRNDLNKGKKANINPNFIGKCIQSLDTPFNEDLLRGFRGVTTEQQQIFILVFVILLIL